MTASYSWNTQAMQLKAALFIAAIVLLIQQARCVTVTPPIGSFYYDSLDPMSNPFNPEDFTTYGSGFVNASGMVVTQQGDPFGTIIFYNQPMPLANGFYTEFVLDITNCDTNPGYLGADGFAFVLFPQLPSRDGFNIPGGSSIGITTSSNLAAVGFVLANDILMVCAANSTSTFGGGSLRDDTTHCVQNTTDNTLKNLRCVGPRMVAITFTSPDSWEIVITQNVTYTFKMDITKILNWSDNYTGYVGFSGGVGAGYMNQQIPKWTFSTFAGCLGTCDPIADCDIFMNNNTATCSCPTGFPGEGSLSSPCIPIRPTANVVPILECYEKYGDGAYAAFYGYNNLEGEWVSIPRGAYNDFYGYNGVINNVPEVFAGGRTPFYPANAFSVEIVSADPFTLTWRLSNYEVSFNSNDASKRCSTELQVLLRFTTGRQLDSNETSLILDQIYNLLVGVSYGRVSVRNITYTTYNAKRQASDVELAELELEISGTNSTTQNEPRAAQTVQQLIEASTNSTRMNEVINPDPDNQDPDRTFVDVKTISTGTETLGQVLPQPTTDTPESVPTTSDATSGNVFVAKILLFAVVISVIFM